MKPQRLPLDLGGPANIKAMQSTHFGQISIRSSPAEFKVIVRNLTNTDLQKGQTAICTHLHVYNYIYIHVYIYLHVRVHVHIL